MRPARAIIGILAGLATVAGCERQQEPARSETAASSTQSPAPTNPVATAGNDNTTTGNVILLSQAQFIESVDEKTGKKKSKPGPARLVILRESGGEWKRDVLEDPGSNVFHKATPFDDPTDDRGIGILTIGAQAAAAKVWYEADGEWTAKTLWETEFGGKWNRLRDFEIGDLTGDGKEDIAIVTHDQGVVAVLIQTDSGWTPTEIDRKEKTFVHEAELGDLDGDGLLEFYATPSHPNRFDGKPQPGEISVYRHKDSGFERGVVEEFPLRHVKEILATDMDGDGTPELYASVEAELGKRADAPPDADKTLVKQYAYADDKYVGEIVCKLPDTLCRFLVAGDVDGDGKQELIAATKKSGIWLARPGEGEWPIELVDSESGGFEHATTLADLDGDGKQEIYVAADDQQEVHRYSWNDGKWKRETIYQIEDDKITFNIFAGGM